MPIKPLNWLKLAKHLRDWRASWRGRKRGLRERDPLGWWRRGRRKQREREPVRVQGKWGKTYTRPVPFIDPKDVD